MHSLLFKIIKAPYYILLFLLLKNSLQAAENNLLIYAAASTNDIFKEIQKNFTEKLNINIRISSSSSSTLAKQIISGAPTNIYISASRLWINELNKKKLLDKNYLKPIFKNKLVLIAPIDTEIKYLKNLNKKNLLNLFNKYLRNSRISIADPSHVPAGIYTKEALTKLKVWQHLNRDNMAWGGDVRRTLKFVALGNSPLGIVYHTDAIAEPKVKIIGAFDDNLHSPINYWATIIKKNNNEHSIRLFNFLSSNSAKNLYTNHGFEIIGIKK
tara:strand:- start:1630 stop:2439 length:810 start_codon:yes stop_codon:yes gene_type:complete